MTKIDEKPKSNYQKKVEETYKHLTPRGEALLKQHIDDEVITKLKGTFGEAIVITKKQLYILKWGYMAGNTFGGRCLAFDYKNITGIEVRKTFLSGTFEVLTPATQNSQKSYWGGGNNDAIKSDNVVTFQSPAYELFSEAGKQIRSFIHTGNKNTDISEYDELEKLAGLRDKGIITEKEFQAKKKKILGL